MVDLAGIVHVCEIHIRQTRRMVPVSVVTLTQPWVAGEDATPSQLPAAKPLLKR